LYRNSGSACKAGSNGSVNNCSDLPSITIWSEICAVASAIEAIEQAQIAPTIHSLANSVAG
jgi:hypothetical protein